MAIVWREDFDVAPHKPWGQPGGHRVQPWSFPFRPCWGACPRLWAPQHGSDSRGLAVVGRVSIMRRPQASAFPGMLAADARHGS